MRGKLSQIMMTISPTIYRRYITVKKRGYTVLYVMVINVIYDIMKGEYFILQEFCWRHNNHCIQYKPLWNMCCKKSNQRQANYFGVAH